MRTRQQSGNIFKARGVWYVRYFDTRVIDGEVKRVRIAKQITPIKREDGTRITKAEARELAKPTLDKINGAPKFAAETALSVCDFVERVYLPKMQEIKRFSTYCGYRDIWTNHLKARCAGLWLREVRCCDIQAILDGIARDRNAMDRCAVCGKPQAQHGTEHAFDGALSRNSLKHLKVALSGMFKFAKQQGYYDGVNPVHDTAIPAGRESAETYAYTLEDISQILAHLPEPAATVFAVAAFTGARRGEISGMLWENYQNGEIQITRSVWHGQVTAPKTRKSTGAIPIIAPLAKRLEFHRLRSGNPASGPMFPNDAGNPMDLNNLVNRIIVPELTRCEMANGWHGWHAARRGLGTNLYRLGVPEKTIQAILRHANVSTTTTYYIKTASADTQAAMAKLENSLSGNELATLLSTPAPAGIQ